MCTGGEVLFCMIFKGEQVNLWDFNSPKVTTNSLHLVLLEDGMIVSGSISTCFSSSDTLFCLHEMRINVV